MEGKGEQATLRLRRSQVAIGGSIGGGGLVSSQAAISGLVPLGPSRTHGHDNTTTPRALTTRTSLQPG